jgi:enoyl-CoA hydratase/carnithine racemase
VLFETRGSVASITFNRPEARNAMTWDMYAALLEACDQADADAAVRVLVLKGAGGRAFVSGTDIAQFTGFSSRQDAIAYERKIDAVIDRLEKVRAATIAQVQGIAAGGGCVMAIACDLRVCAADARFGVPIARTLGNCLSGANYARLVDLIGPSRTKDLLLTGRLVGAEEAAAIGMATQIVDAERLDAAVETLAATLAANAPLTIRATKEAIRRIQESRRRALPDMDDLIAECYGSHDFKEGIASFLEKRAPVFTGR